MADVIRGRYAPTPPKPYPGSAETPAGVFAWNRPREAIGTERADKPIEEWAFRQGLRAEPMPRARRVRRRLASLPNFIRRYYAQRADSIEAQHGTARANKYLFNTFEKHVLPRIDGVNDRYRLGVVPGVLISFQDDFARLPWYGKRDLKRLAHRLTDCITAEFMNYYQSQVDKHGDVSFAVLYAYGRAGWVVSHLNMFAPGWGSYCDMELTDVDALRCMARLESPAWWLRRLKRMHDQWREHLMIAAGYVSKKTTPYCSDPALKEWKAQKKANLEYLKAMELEDQDTGERVSLIEKVVGSVANPAVRRHELMARMRGFENVADDLGLVGDFYTLTAPSKYHAMHNSGKRNDKWNGANPRQTQKYLCRIWARVRAAWKRAGIRAFGFRVVEPHHDETPHWHLLLFMRPEDIDQARDIFCLYARWEDSEELQGIKALEARFYAKPIDKEKGSATGYIAKYISKNIDGYALDGEIDDDTGLPLKDTARRVNAWASRWRIRQFQQLGGAPVTVYRELRRLRDRDLYLHPEIAPAHVAADEGDWAGYTVAQGGPLVARDCIRVRLNYEVTPDGNAYGDDVSRINGIYAPASGPDSLIFTRTSTYKIVPKAKADEGLAVDVQGASRPLGVLSITVPVADSTAQGSGLAGALMGEDTSQIPADFDHMTRQERRESLDRLRTEAQKQQPRDVLPDKPRVITPETAADMDDIARQLLVFVRSIGLEPTPWEFNALLSGAVVNFGSGHAFKLDGDRLLPVG
ncbi:Bacteriophage replication gene A protein (GPA) [Serratia entomophila]|uniref:replication endonuclease n=1 Tax=Serratia entomophila TaxID=42906 RepID=UPI00217A8D2B|nr:replication endonuclease [Serratia entomophila]CAI1155578.1 Bacteriophage replication gene A protein (GPA) [Serratia entomophila]CAI1177058.1 Bacteriophage replication gene A protein (GPA) [Serratia entomophila]